MRPRHALKNSSGMGRKSGMTASTRLSIPSVSFLPSRMLGRLQDPEVHGQIVVPRGDDEVRRGDRPCSLIL